MPKRETWIGDVPVAFVLAATSRLTPPGAPRPVAAAVERFLGRHPQFAAGVVAAFDGLERLGSWAVRSQYAQSIAASHVTHHMYRYG